MDALLNNRYPTAPTNIKTTTQTTTATNTKQGNSHKHLPDSPPPESRQLCPEGLLSLPWCSSRHWESHYEARPGRRHSTRLPQQYTTLHLVYFTPGAGRDQVSSALDEDTKCVPNPLGSGDTAATTSTMQPAVATPVLACGYRARDLSLRICFKHHYTPPMPLTKQTPSFPTSAVFLKLEKQSASQQDRNKQLNQNLRQKKRNCHKKALKNQNKNKTKTRNG